MADTLLTEREALTVRRNFPRFTEDQRAVATSKLESYRQAQEAAGLPLFPSRSQEIVNQRDKTQSIWLEGEEGWKKHSDGKAAPWRDATEFREFQRASVLSSMFGDADPVDVASNPKAYRTRLGQQLKRPDLGTDDAAFDAYITKTFQEDRKNQALKYTDENSLYSAIIEAAHDPSNNRGSGGAETFLDWATANSKNIPAGKLSQWSEEAKTAFRVQRQRRDLALSRANKIINAVENGEPIETAIAPMMGLHPSDTALTYNMVQHLAGDERGKDKGVGEKLGESVGRQLLRLASGVTGSIQQQAQLPFKEGQKVFEDLIGNPDEMALERQTEFSRQPGASLLGDAAQFAKGRRRVKLTAQQAQAGNDAQNRLRERRLVLQQIQDADKGILDPVRKDWWGAHILYGGAETVTSMASYMVPFVGVGANALAFQSEAEDKLVAAGASRDDAKKASVYTAAGQAALDRLQLGLVKKVPGIGGALKKLAQRKNPLSNKTLKSLAKGAAIVGAETGIELLQDPGVPAAVQHIFEGLGADMPEVDWAEIWQEVKDQAPDVALSMIIPAALGSGFFASGKSSAIPQQGTGRTVMAQATKYGYEADPYGDTNSINGIGHANNQLEEGLSVALSRKTARKLGIKPKQTTDLLVTLPDGTQLSARYDDTIPGRYKEDRIDFYTPSGELAFDGEQVQISVVGEGAESIKDIQGGLDDSARIDSAINSVAGVRQVTRDADGWSVELESGESLSVDSHEAALALREDLRQAATEREAQAMVDLQDYFQSTGTETESLAFTGELATASDTGAVTFSRDGEVTRILDDPRSMETMRAELDALATGDAGAVGREIVAAVNGMNVVETREGVSTLASQVFQGGGIKAQIHETVEARFRALLANGTITEGESLSFVQGIEEATGEKFIKGEATPDAIREAVSEIAVADFVSRRKSDKRLPGNAITAGLEEMIRSAASPAEAKALGKFRAFLRAARAFFKDVFKAAAALKRARAEGKLENEQEFLDQLLGLEPQRQHNEAVVREADPDYIPPTAEEEADGIAFSIATEQSPTGEGPTVTIAPVRKDNIDSFNKNEAAKRVKSAKFTHLDRTFRDTLEAFGVKPIGYQPVIGGWRDTVTGEVSMEVPIRVELDTDFETASLIADIVAMSAPEMQNAAMVFRPMPMGSKEANAIQLRIRAKSATTGEQIAKKWLNRNPESGFTFDPSTRNFEVIVDAGSGDARIKANAAFADFVDLLKNENLVTKSQAPDAEWGTSSTRNEEAFAGAIGKARVRAKGSSRGEAIRDIAARAERRLSRHLGSLEVQKKAKAELEKRKRPATAAAAIIAAAKGRKFKNIRELALWLDDRFKRRFRVGMKTIGDPATRRAAADALIYDVLEGLSRDGSGSGWYDERIKETLNEIEKVHPEVSTDPGAAAVFFTILASTSQGYTVTQNFEVAESVYQGYKDTGRIPTDGKFAQASDAINANLTQAQQLIDERGIEWFTEFMDREVTGGYLKKELGALPTGVTLKDDVRGNRILGPKIGSFFNNLRGRFDTVTMDLWFTRSMHRYVGETAVPLESEKLQKALEDFREHILTSPRQYGLDPDGFQQPRDGETKGQFDERTLEGALHVFNRWSAGDEKNGIKSYNKFEDGYSLEKSARTIKQNSAMKGAPQNKTHRKFFESIVHTSKRQLEKMGFDVTEADIQAIVWYAEKNLFAEMGVASNAAKPADYLDAAMALRNKMADGTGVWNKSRKRANVSVGSTALGSNTFSVSSDYRIQHQPSSEDSPLPSLEEMFGDDIYGPNAIRYYGVGQAGEREAVEVFRRVKGKPDELVTIYRVVPDFVESINPGDWVTISKAAAEGMNYPEFLGGGLGGEEQKSKVLEKEVKAGEVRWPGDSLVEQGYFPEGDVSFSISSARTDRHSQWAKSLEKTIEQENEGVRVWLTGTQHGLVVNTLKVEENSRRQGKARRAMESILAEAETQGVPVLLNAEPFGDSIKQGQLKGFYKSMGFEVADNETRIETGYSLVKLPSSDSFSISSEEYLERVAQRVAGLSGPPKERLEFAERARAKLSNLASSLLADDNISKALSKNAIRKEKQVRKKADIENRLESIHEANPILEQEDIARLRANPLIEFLALKSKGPVRLNILSRSRAARRPGFRAQHGDYDGSHAIPGQIFGGTDASSAPDIVAQTAFDSGLIASPTPDALWQEIERAMREAATNKESLSVAKQEIASAKRIAQKDADAWEAEQLSTLSRRQKNTATKDLETAIRSLDALLLGLPAEIRAKVGGFARMASLRTNEAREAYLKDKVERANRELERFLVGQYREDLATILDKATPKMKGGERPSGNLGEAGHRFFDQVREVAGLTEVEIEAERAKVATLQQEEENIESAERMADLFEQEQILDAFGGALTHMDAAGLAQALFQAQSVFTENRNKWRMVEEQRLKEVADLRSEIISKLGQPTVRKKLAEIRKRDSKLKRLDDTAMGFISWVQTLEAVLGVNHPLVKRWNEAVGDAQAQKTDAMIVMNKRLERVVREAIGGKASQLDAMQWMWDLNNKPAVTVSIKRGSNEDGSRAQTGRRVPVDVALRVIEDSQQATTLGFTPADVGALKQLFETNKNEREFFALPGDYEPGTPELVELTEAEALTVSLLSLQDQYAENLEKWGYDQEALAAIEESLSKEAKQIRQWMLNEYAEGWEPMNRVFSRMYGVALPQIGNYSPGNFEHIGADREMDAFGEGLMPTGGMRNGSLKTRKTHRAEPRIVSALGVYTSHVAQSEHFQAFAELTRELRGVFAHPAVKGAIKSSAGEEASGKVLKWIEVMENNGLQNPVGKDEATDKAKRLQGRLARIALAGKLGTLMVQSTAAMASSARIGQQAYWAGFARMMTGQGHYREFFSSPMIRRRIEAGASPAQRAAASRVMDRRPTRAAQGELWLMDLIGRVDGGFTAASGAIAYDYHLRQLTEAGMPETIAKAQAMREAEDVVRRTAQPVESTDKSLTELKPDAFARYFLLFASDARKNAAMVLEPLRRAMAPRQSKKRDRAKEILRDKDFWRAAMFTNVLAGGMAYLIRSAWWDMRDDDDYELFDDKHWSAWAALRAMSFAPLEGFPLVRDVVSSFKGGPLDGLDRALGQITTLLEDIFKRDLGSTPIERIERTAVATANASALLSERAVPVAVAANIFDQLFDVLDNTFDDSEEAEKKERARQRAE